MIKKYFVLLFLFISGCGLINDDSDSFFANYNTQDLYNNEIHPAGSSIENGFDATLEEVLHMVTQQGYAYAYPNSFGETKGSTIANYMDTARGGYYATVPTNSDTSWYHYNVSCNKCQITEYFYWSLTSILVRTVMSLIMLQQIQDEWELNTSANE